MRGGSRNELYDYPDDEWTYYVCAKEFGWTPDIVDEQPVYLLSYILAINTAVKEIEIERQSP